MRHHEPPRPLHIALFSIVLVALAFLLQARIGFTYSDEGFLWYGAVQTLAGEIPIRDFQSYDPGRYYWSAFWMAAFGESVLALRGAVALFQLLGVVSGLLVLRRAVPSWRVLVPVGFLLIVWMSPRYYRMFEISASLIALHFAVILIERPTLRRHFVTGVFTGLAAFFGRNLGLYSLASFGLLIVFVWFRLDRADLFKRLVYWSLGIAAGYSPMLIMLLAVPGFYEGVVASVVEIGDRGATNITLPIPWPWIPDYAQMSLQNAAHVFSTGFLFLWMPVFYLAAAGIVLRSSVARLRNRAVLLAGLAVGVMYIHYAFSRADLEHLLVATPVMLISLAALPLDHWGNRAKQGHRVLLVAFAALTLFSAGMKSPLYLKATAPAAAFVQYEVRGSDLWIPVPGAKLLETIERINREVVPEDEGFLIAPYLCALYGVLERQSPLRELYFTDQKSTESEQATIARLVKKRVNWVLLGNVQLHEQSVSRFRVTHPLLWEHLRTDFSKVDVAGLRHSFSLLKRNE